MEDTVEDSWGKQQKRTKSDRRNEGNNKRWEHRSRSTNRHLIRALEKRKTSGVKIVKKILT